MPHSLLKQQKFPSDVTLVKINLSRQLPCFCFVQQMSEEDGQESEENLRCNQWKPTVQ